MATANYFYREVKKYKSLMRDYIDQAKELIKKCDINTDIGVMVSSATRIKILEHYYEIFKAISNKNPDTNELISKKLKRICKLTKLHFFQLKKLKQKNQKQNKLLFVYLHKAVLTYMVSNLNNKIK